MALFQSILERLIPPHRAALQWFHDHAGQEVSWPERLADGTFIVNKAKGIHKPAGIKYAVSIRQSLNGPYADKQIIQNSDGSWTYRYFQEQLDPAQRDSQFTNVALMACRTDGIPVGVIRQVKAKPNPRYEVLGLAFVTDWHDGYFVLNGPGSACLDMNPAPLEQIEQAIDFSIAFNPADIEDARRWVNASIVLRQGQGAFRDALLSAYERRCAISDRDVEPVLEAAHIHRYMGTETNVVKNGLLLRADLHTLYDRALITVDPGTLQLLLSPELKHTEYEAFEGCAIRLPKKPEWHPSPAALLEHTRWVRSLWEERAQKRRPL